MCSAYNACTRMGWLPGRGILLDRVENTQLAGVKKYALFLFSSARVEMISLHFSRVPSLKVTDIPAEPTENRPTFNG
jgi:hypothetical protein